MGEPKARPGPAQPAGPRPFSVTWAANLATANLLIGLLASFWVLRAFNELAIFPAALPTAVFWLFVIRRFLAGRNRARVLYLVGTAISVLWFFYQLPRLFELPVVPIDVIALGAVARGIDAITIGLLLSPPSNAWFRLPLASPPRLGAA